MSDYETVIGLETHIQLNTTTKLFSGAPNRFGDEPNTNISITDTAQPGSLPVLNREAVHKAILFGLAIDADIAKLSKFDRKSYFYPDSPRNFQITQFYHPIIKGGTITCDINGELKTFAIHHAHLEDDAGGLKHFSTFAGVDYNRAGAPLLEIVSEPCLHSAQDAIAYAQMIKAIMQYIGASDCNMEEGHLRMDVNISIRPKGSKELRGKIEIKNMNSFTNMGLAIEAEVKRQKRIYQSHPDQDPMSLIQPATFRFDPERQETLPMRSKEMAADYRYFPEPDLPPLIISQEMIDTYRSNLPELPYARFQRYLTTLSLTEYNANILTNDKKLSDYFEEALTTQCDPKLLCNWMTVEFAGRLKQSSQTLPDLNIPPKHIGQLVKMIETGAITGRIAKSVADIMLEHPEKTPESIVRENPDFQPLSDTDTLGPIIDRILAANAQSVTDYRAGGEKAFNYLIGQIMKETRGKADPTTVRNILKTKLTPPQ